MKTLKLKAIRFDGDTQMRVELNGDAVADYRDAMKNGATFPPLIVFFDGSDNWIGDGYHRWHAAREAGFDDIECDVRQGSRRDAILYACLANSTNGLRRTNEDKRKAVATLIKDDEWAAWSDRVIAEKCGVSNQMVSNVRNQLSTVDNSNGNRKGKDGKSYKAKRREIVVKVVPEAVSDEESGEDDRTDAQGKKPQEEAPRPTRTVKEKPGDVPCPNCTNRRWTEGVTHWVCTKCGHFYGECVGDRDDDEVVDERITIKKAKARKTIEAAMREFDDLQVLVPNPKEHADAILTCKSLLNKLKTWN